jgi:hypothetical protein
MLSDATLLGSCTQRMATEQEIAALLEGLAGFAEV